MKKYAVPYQMSYDTLTRHWEVSAHSKTEARLITKQQLSTDQEVTRIASERYIVDMGEIK